MKVRNWTSAMALGAALLGFTAFAQAHGDMGHGSMGGESGPRHIEKMAQKIGLTAAQQEQLKALNEKQRAAAKANREERKKLQAERSAAWTAPTLDAARLESLRQQEVKLFDAISRQRLEHQLAVAKILTPEQRQKMAQWRMKRHDRKDDDDHDDGHHRDAKHKHD